MSKVCKNAEDVIHLEKMVKIDCVLLNKCGEVSLINIAGPKT